MTSAGSGGGCPEALPNLLEGAARLGVALSARQIEQLVRYCELVQESNKRFNLTGLQAGEAITRVLLLDSLTFQLALPQAVKTPAPGQHPRVVDVGSGAGVPGIPLKIVFPQCALTLIESVGKKARFLETVVTELELDGVEVLAERAETAACHPERRDAADVCTARAVAPLSALLELCSPFVRPEGYLILPKSGSLHAELDASTAAARALRLQLRRVVEIPEELGLGAGRVIVVYAKVGTTPAGYPRRVGLARSRPIGTRPQGRVSRHDATGALPDGAVRPTGLSEVRPRGSSMAL